MSLLSSPPRSDSSGLPAVSGAAPRARRPVRPALAVAVVVLSALLAGLLLFHRAIPDIAGVGLLIDSIAPWFGLFVPVLLVLALLSRRRRSLASVLVPAVVWALLFGPGIVPLSWTAESSPSTGGTAPALEAGGAAAAPGSDDTAAADGTTAASGADGTAGTSRADGTATEAAPASASASASATTLTVASQNIEASSETGDISARALAATGADVIALEEMTSDDFDAISGTLAAAYPYSFGVGTVGLWSKYPVINAQPLNLGLGWNRALAADLDTPQGLVSIYVIHAASARPGEVSARDSMLTALAETLPNDENERVIAVGDFNAASTDRAMSGITDQLAEPNQTDGMFGNTWPSTLPVTRLDHLLQRGMTVSSNTTLAAGASDHRAILTSLTL